MPEELIQPDFPEELTHVWDAFIQMSASRQSSGGGPAPITYQDMEAWMRLTRKVMRPREVRTIKEMDGICLSLITERYS